MKAAGAILVLGAGLAALVFLPKKAAAAPRAPRIPHAPRTDVEDQPTPEELAAAKEASYAQTLISQAYGACQDPATCNVAFVKNKVKQIRSTSWVHPDVKAKAYKAANDLEAMAQDASDYQQALKDYQAQAG